MKRLINLSLHAILKSRIIIKMLNNKKQLEITNENKLKLFELMRYDYYQKYTHGIENLLTKLDINIPTKNINNDQEEFLHDFINNEKLDWGATSFHLKNKVQDINDLISLRPELESKKESILNITTNKGYLLSILPLNLFMPEEVLLQFIPPDDFSVPHPLKDIDPYGIASPDAKIIINSMWVATKKFEHTVLMNIHGHCPIGCSDCYKSFYVREKGHESELGAGDPYEKVPKKLENQTKYLVEWLNTNPQIYDVIISGGEPFLRQNSHIKILLNEFKKARYLRILRFCTGVIFLGLPFRIDDELLDIINEFTEEADIKITFQAHISNHLQISPEAVLAVKKIKKRGFNIYSQTPIKKGINFFLDDLEKTIFYLRELVKKQFLIGVEPYKFIVDMHPRTLAYYIPIEALIKVYGHLFDSHIIPELERPKTVSILSKQGNIVLSSHSLFAMKKEVDYSNKFVKYRIPKLTLNDELTSIEEFIYTEPLSSFNEDPNSLEKLRKSWFKE